MEVVVFIGVPGAGKTTFYRERFASTHVHLSKDNWPNARHKEQRLRQLLAQALEAGHPVVVDNTHPTRVSRAGVLEVARRHGARVVGYFFHARLRECLSRNAGRKGRARVPDEAIYILAAQLQPPHLSEGFDVLYQVMLTPRGFDVATWEPEAPGESAGGAA
ncbi:MAG: ATP-binding protein [Myxococcaceae bacterium]|nr:ATP-binding protein [Myxococcaceae bacterium]MCI0671387.1 ATP-binding protein [Myxococcaceae bacterium]